MKSLTFSIALAVLCLASVSAQAQKRPAPIKLAPGRTIAPPAKPAPRIDTALRRALDVVVRAIYQPTLEQKIQKEFVRASRSFATRGIDSTIAYRNILASIDTTAERKIVVNAIRKEYNDQEIIPLARFLETPTGQHFASTQPHVIAVVTSDVDQLAKRTVNSRLIVLSHPVRGGKPAAAKSVAKTVVTTVATKASDKTEVTEDAVVTTSVEREPAKTLPKPRTFTEPTKIMSQDGELIAEPLRASAAAEDRSTLPVHVKPPEPTPSAKPSAKAAVSAPVPAGSVKPTAVASPTRSGTKPVTASLEKKTSPSVNKTTAAIPKTPMRASAKKDGPAPVMKPTTKPTMKPTTKPTTQAKDKSASASPAHPGTDPATKSAPQQKPGARKPAKPASIKPSPREAAHSPAAKTKVEDDNE